MKTNGENCKSFWNGRKVMKLWIITLQFKLKKQNKQNNLLTLTVSYEKSCLIRKKINKLINGNSNNKNKIRRKK